MDLSTVRSLAATYGFEELFFSTADKVIVFLMHDEAVSDMTTRGLPVALVVWYTTKTVGIITSGPHGSYTIPWILFDVPITHLRDIFLDPLSHFFLQHYTPDLHIADWCRQTIRTEEATLRRRLEGIAEEQDILARQQEAIEQRLQELPSVSHSPLIGRLSSSLIKSSPSFAPYKRSDTQPQPIRPAGSEPYSFSDVKRSETAKSMSETPSSPPQLGHGLSLSYSASRLHGKHQVNPLTGPSPGRRQTTVVYVNSDAENSEGNEDSDDNDVHAAPAPLKLEESYPWPRSDWSNLEEGATAAGTAVPLRQRTFQRQVSNTAAEKSRSSYLSSKFRSLILRSPSSNAKLSTASPVSGSSIPLEAAQPSFLERKGTLENPTQFPREPADQLSASNGKATRRVSKDSDETSSVSSNESLPSVDDAHGSSLKRWSFMAQKSRAGPELARFQSQLSRSGTKVSGDVMVSSTGTYTAARLKGNRCLFCFASEAHYESFGTAWSERPVRSVALARGYVIVYEDGGVAWYDIPTDLDQALRKRQLPPDGDSAEGRSVALPVRLPPVQTVALGPHNNYFLKWTSGKMEWVAKDSFQDAMYNGVTRHKRSVSRVALGGGGSWVILWKDGLVQYDGIPQDLDALLLSYSQTPQDAGELEVDDSTPLHPEGHRNPIALGIRDISLGANGEWFVIFSDHSVQANNLPDSLHAALGQIKREGGRVRHVVFGTRGVWYIRYWDGTGT